MNVKLNKLNKKSFYSALKNTSQGSQDFVIFSTPALGNLPASSISKYLIEAVRVLKDGGLLFVHGLPEYLPELGVDLDSQMLFKYWIAIESLVKRRKKSLPTSHTAILLFTKGNGRFNIKQHRFPHASCSACGKNLKDWGGKSHLMHPDGTVFSDVWKAVRDKNNYNRMSKEVLDILLDMVNLDPKSNETIRGILAPQETLVEAGNSSRVPYLTHEKPIYGGRSKKPPTSYINQVINGDVVETLKKVPDGSVDLVFADPPYNLEKNYTAYDDGLAEQQYINWCNSWLKEYARILSPTGSLFLLNLPRWSMYHARFLNQYLHFQNWIVWDALSEPRGKIMPAHYGLLFYTKDSSNFTFNYNALKQIESRKYCLRSSCIKNRKKHGDNGKEPLTDIWWDVHRIKHKKDRDYHPCQLPNKLMERIILLSTNEGDVVLDALAGTGTTAISALNLKRKYIAIDVDKKYVDIMNNKLQQIKLNGFVEKKSIQKATPIFSKKELQLELKSLTQILNRLPSEEDIIKFSKYDLNIFHSSFPNWSKALKAAKLELINSGNRF